jgi:hypothetical protein
MPVLRLWLLEQGVECAAGVTGIARALAIRRRRRRGSGRRCVARHSNTRFEQVAFVGFILQRNPDRNGLQALKARGRFEVGALLAAVQSGSAFRAVAAEIGSAGKLRGAVIAPGRGNGLNQPREPRTGHIDGWARPRLPGPIIAVSLGFEIRALGVHIAPLFVLAIAIHGEVEFTP